MKRLTIASSIAIITLLSACAHFRSAQRAPTSEYYVDPEYQSFQNLTSEAFTFRANAIQFAQEKNLDKTKSITLTREEGESVRNIGIQYLEIRKKLLQLVSKEQELFEIQNEVKLEPYRGTRTENVLAGTRKIFHLDPMDAQGEQTIFRIQMALASALILMDNYLVAIQPYNENPTLQYVLNYDAASREALQDVADSYALPSNRTEIENAIKFVDKLMTWRREGMVPTSPEQSNMYSLIQSSIWYLSVKNGSTNGFMDMLANIWDKITLKGTRGVRVISYGASMGFGNMVGLVATRKGYLYDMEMSEKEALIKEMKPLDILMEKTPFRLTDKMIPGHYGHVAIWLGTEEQLKDLKVWDQIPEKIQNKIRSGHRIVEALRPGVEINTLEHFLNIDDFLVIRDKRPNITDEYRRKAILQAIAQIGKEYDFNFDVHTHKRIVCSEIAYVVFSDIKWPLEETLKRYTISPDNVVQMAINENRIFEPVILYYNGKRYYKDLPYSLSLLLQANDRSYRQFEKFQNQ